MRIIVPSLVLTASAIVLSGIVILMVHYATGIDVQVLVVDPAAEVDLAPYVGIFTYIGVLIVWSGATVSFMIGLLS